MGTKRTGKMPNRGKLLAPIEKAPCPILNQNRLKFQIGHLAKKNRQYHENKKHKNKQKRKVEDICQDLGEVV